MIAKDSKLFFNHSPAKLPDPLQPFLSRGSHQILRKSIEGRNILPAEILRKFHL